MQWAHTVGSQGTPPVSAAALPQAPGVYRFRDRAGRALYIGRAVSLRRRVLSYWGDLGDRAHLAPMVARIARIEAVTCDSAHEAAWLERNLLEHRRPPSNRTPGGQEAEVWIRLSASPRRPGLTVVRQPAPATSARTWAARRCATRCPGSAGSFRSATPGTPGREPNVPWPGCVAPRPRRGPGWPGPSPRCWTGTGCGGRAARRADRPPRRRRGRAGLRVRGRLQAELEALDWVTGEQKVTGAQDDADVCGWADGVLVWFEIRDGRMRGWRQRPCGRRRPPPPDRDAARLGRFRPPQCRTSGAAQVRWQKLNQLPESSRSSASMP